MAQRIARITTTTAIAVLTMCGAAHAQTNEFETFTWTVILTIGAVPFVLSIPLALERAWQAIRRHLHHVPAA